MGLSGDGQEEKLVFVLTMRKINRIKRVAALMSQDVVIHQCKQCNYETERKEDVTKHSKTHSGEKNCKSSFKSDLDRHVLTHQIPKKAISM